MIYANNIIKNLKYDNMKATKCIFKDVIVFAESHTIDVDFVWLPIIARNVAM